MRPPEHKVPAGTSPADNSRTKDPPVPKPLSCGMRLQRALHQPKALSALLPVQRKRRAFSGGQAPGCLLRKLIQPADRVKKLNQLCAWVEMPVSIPRLQEGPLLGSCMKELVSARGPRSGAETSSPTIPGSSLDHFDGFQRRTTRHLRDDEKYFRPQPWAFRNQDFSMKRSESTAHTTPSPSVHSHSVSDAFLRRFGSSITTDISSNAPLFRKKMPSHFGRNKSGNPFTEGTDNQQVAFQYVSRITRRFISNLMRFEKRHLERNAFSAMIFSFSTSSSWAQASLSASLGGPRAPLDRLLNLARQANLVDGTAREETVSQTRTSKTHPAIPIQVVPLARTATSRSLASELAQQGFYPQVGSLPLPETGLDGGQPLVATPLATNVPPTLLPPVAPFEAPTPFASAKLHQEALQDETDLVQEDLDHLADKIKQILDEEARRHGIQV